MAAITPLVVIVGETGSGKTALGIALAKQFNGEIIAADSRTVYTGMDIGTAKPSLPERGAVPHHLIDVAAPDETFTAADFKHQAAELIEHIHERHHVPFIVGGTGLYVDALLYDYAFLPVPPAELRARLATMSVDELQAEVRLRRLPLPANERNPRHLARVIETNGQQLERRELRQHTLLLGLRVEDRAVREQRLRDRVTAMFQSGLVQEVEGLVQRYGTELEAFRAPGYRAVVKYLQGELSFDEAKEAFVKSDLALAKRQRTWFKRNKSIHWINEQAEAVDLLTTFLNKYHI